MAAVKLLGRDNFVFTADKDGLAGFIVPSDLDRHAVRSYFYLLVAGIEMLLSEIIKSVMPEKVLLAAMDPRTRKHYDQAHKANIEAHPVETFLIQGSSSTCSCPPHAGTIPSGGMSLCRSGLSAVRKFRNSVMHPTRSIAATTSPSRAAELASWAEEVANRLHRTVITLRANENV